MVFQNGQRVGSGLHPHQRFPLCPCPVEFKPHFFVPPSFFGTTLITLNGRNSKQYVRKNVTIKSPGNHFTRAEKELANTLVATDYKDPPVINDVQTASGKEVFGTLSPAPRYGNPR